MADKGNRIPLVPNDANSVEQKMRRALGLNAKASGHTPQQRPEQARQRHRFVQDGGVPVTVLNPRHDAEAAGLRERVAELQASLEAERSAHAGTRRALQEQQASAQALQTRLAHAELAHKEALAQERQARVAAQEALAQAAAQAAAQAVTAQGTAGKRAAAVGKPATPAEAADASAADAHVADAPAAGVRGASVTDPAGATIKPKRGRPRTAPPPEPKPVRWWTPSFRAKTKA